MQRLISLLLKPFGPYILLAVGIVVLGFASAAAVQSYRLMGAKLRIIELESSIAKAAADSEIRGAKTGAAAVIQFKEKVIEDAKPVARVVERIRNVCLRRPANYPAVPQGPTPVDGAAAEAEVSGDDAFVSALTEDLASCTTELHKLESLQKFVCENGGC